ncbi:MAG: sulfate ABC transporter permease subunit CysT [Actinomycetota bacterium]|nr:sulfate ABC transporter permease subunit CysT [Actinomycetota bacterium]MDQ2958669.1 sulfate ABC transporter permease subunit CysT [Actinomycetota bacterium]
MSLATEPAAAPLPARQVGGGTPQQQRLGLISGAGLGVAVLWLSLLVLLPLAAVVVKGTGAGWSGFSSAFTNREAFTAIRLTVLCSLGVSLVNAVMGTVIAWVLVRDDFPGKRLLEILIDIPFALPTIVAGLVLLSLYGQQSPVGINAYGTRPGILLALLFVTLPFVVRTVQPVLLSLETDAEEAARSLGASPFTTFRRIVLPGLLPAIVSGSALAFGRAMGEYGSVVLISGQLQYKTEVASSYIYKQLQDDNLAGAAATAVVLLVISLLVISLLGFLQRWTARRG